jgi:hypothetical protein
MNNMKTIEEFEMEIGSKITLAQEGLIKFGDNVSRIGSVIGKDPTQVYNVLNSALSGVIDRFNSMAAKNSETLQPLVDRLDKILDVLAAVIIAINNIEQSAGDNVSDLDVKNEVNAVIEKASTDADSLIDTVPSTVVTYSPIVANPGVALLAGVAAYFIATKVANLGPFAGFAIAAGAAYYMGTAGEK